MNNFTIPRNTKGSGGGDRGRPNSNGDGNNNSETGPGPGPGPGRGGDNNFTVPRRSSGGGGGGSSRPPHNANPIQSIPRHGHGGGSGGPGRSGTSNDRDRDRHRGGGGGGGHYGPSDRDRGGGGPPAHDRHRFPPIQGDQRQQHHQQNQRQPHHISNQFNGDRRPSSHHDRDRHGRPGDLHRERSSSGRDRDRDRDGFARQGSLSRTSSQGDRLTERGGSSRNSPTPRSGSVSPSPLATSRPYDIEVASEDPFKIKFRASSSYKAMIDSPSLLALFPRPTASNRSAAPAAGGAIPRKTQNKRKLMSDDDDDEDGALHDSSSSDDGGAGGGGGDDSFFPTTSGATKTNKRTKIGIKKSSDSIVATDKPTTTKSGTGRGGGRLKRAKKASLNDDSEDDEVLKELLAPVEEDPADVIDDPNAIDAPPPGELASLWYSREQFLHVWAIEKILAWKLRPKPVPPKAKLELETSLKLHEAAIAACADNASKRMEISRIHALNCPVVTEMARNMLDVDTVEEGEEEEAPTPAPAATAREECYLIKWRGRSYRHCSWERYADLVKFDPSNNSAAKSKINRYGQSQELAFGKHWKQVLEDSRRLETSAISSAPEGSGSTASEQDSTAVVAAAAAAALVAPPPEEEEYFQSDYLEVERIVGCDEGEIDMTVFAKQRTINLEEEKKEEEAAAQESCEFKRRTKQTKQRLDAAMHKVKDCLAMAKDPDWDPEDYVQYAVKWKALTLNEITFEYWKDLKIDYIELAENFWHRQKVPSEENIVAKPHPELQQFQKMKESPTFGVSNTPRPVYDLEKKAVVDPATEKKEVDDDDEDEKLKQAQALLLRSYQLEGVNWLLWNWWNKRSCILADEMGLGKTIQTVGFLNQLMFMDATKIRGPFLVVAPLSLIAQWQSEAAVWAPDFNVIVYHGSANARSYLVNNEFYYGEPFVNKTTAQKLRRNNVTKFHVMITTYEVVMKDIEMFQKMKWRAIIVDEAHRLKNNKSRLFADLAAVPRDFCLLLTGTPLQNSTEELWALLNFADPIQFESRDSFIDKFGQLSDAKQVSDLHSILKPYLLRRVKEDVAKSLPPKVETILEVSLTPLQKTFYKAIYERNTSHLFKGAKPSNSPSLMNIMMELRKCCNHPFLIRGAEEKIVGEAATAAVAAAKAAGGTEADVNMAQLTTEQLVKSSGKMVLLEKLLPKLFDGGHKVLIFSQMVRTLDILNDFLRMKGYSLERLDGSTSAAARNAADNRFNRKSLNRFVMLLSTRAGGLGLNLTAADTIIIFDSDWNPQNDLQAMARAHRIGQTRAVSVYRLLTAKTYEMHMFHSASMKLGLDRAMLAQQRQTEQADEAGGELDPSKVSKSNRAIEREKQAKEIDELLKKGAYDVFRDDDDKEAKEFMETDIDALLERSTKTVTYGSASNNMSSGLGSFSKASFVATTGEGEDKDIDLDDPDFWKKAVGLDAPAEVDDETAALVQAYADKKRVRKQIVNYGADPYAEYMEAERKEKEKVKLKAKADREEKEKQRSDKKKKGSADKDGKKSKSGDGKSSISKSANSAKPSSDKKKSSSGSGGGKDGGKLKISANSKLNPPPSSSSLIKTIDLGQKTVRFENIKYAWEPQHRDAVVDAILSFGFGRCCKIRQESNLPGLPIQDFELFARYYLYQLGLQASVSLMSQFKQNTLPAESADGPPIINCCEISQVLEPIAQCGAFESKFILGAISSSLQMQEEVCSNLRQLRMIPSLTDTAFVSKLRKGEALKGLRRLACLTRLNSIMSLIIDGVVRDLGPEELGKRGSATKNRGELELDVKTKLVTVEELSHAVAQVYTASGARHGRESLPIPCPWWDRSCDIALLIGNFLCGYGNYETISYDEQLPFAWKLKSYARQDLDSLESMERFNEAVQATSNVVKESIAPSLKALGVDKPPTLKAVNPVTSAVEVKIKKEEPPVGGQVKVETDIVLKAASTDSKSSCAALTLTGLQNAALEGMRLSRVLVKKEEITCSSVKEEGDVIKKEETVPKVTVTNSKLKRLPMPDGRILDGRLLRLLDEMETILKLRGSSASSPTIPNDRGVDTDLWVDNYNEQVLSTASCRFLSSFPTSSHPDSSHYMHGPASSELEAFASSSHSKKVSNGVPRVLTRISVSALLYSPHAAVDTIAKLENTEEKQGYNIPEPLLESDATRRKLSVHLLNTGFPCTSTEKFLSVASGVLKLFPGTTKNLKGGKGAPFYSCRQMVANLPEESLLSTETAVAYVEDVLIPHCLRLCLHGNGTASRVFQKPPNISKKKKDSAPTSICTELKLNESAIQSSYERLLPSNLATIPDPIVALNLHADESIVRALAILRRYRLMKSIRFIVGGGIQPHVLIAFFKGPVMRRNMSDLPLWWCPWIHDLAVLVHAATHGLFALFDDASALAAADKNMTPAVQGVLGNKHIKDHIRSVFVGGQNGGRPRLPQCYLTQAENDDDTSDDDDSSLQEWIEAQAKEFPTPQVLERRLGLICASLTGQHSSSFTKEEREILLYDHVPMFDHGAWPASGNKTRMMGGVKYGQDVKGVVMTQSLLKTAEEDPAL